MSLRLSYAEMNEIMSSSFVSNDNIYSFYKGKKVMLIGSTSQLPLKYKGYAVNTTSKRLIKTDVKMLSNSVKYQTIEYARF